MVFGINEIGKKVTDNPTYYYNIALNYFNEAKANDDEIKDLIAKNHSVSYLLHHDFIPAPCIVICLKLFKEQKDEVCIGSYHLYIDGKETFIDEYLTVGNCF